jgi:aminopeptidase N/puromycin-sensitive aminopeptidase
VVPDHYNLKFTPDFASNTFAGNETIDVHVLQPTKTIVLDAVEIKFNKVSVTSGGKHLTADVTPNGDKESVTLALSSEVAPGAASIQIEYVGQLNDKLRGMYRSESNNRKYVITQFEAVDARVAFPSFDEPAYKATFDITAVVDNDDTAISNGRIVSDQPGPSGKHTIKFSSTPKMSTYLVALTVGDWKCVSGEQDGIALRVCATPGREEQGKFALEATKAILHYYNQYFAIKYPYGKLDQIAAPDFEAGAMENTATIIYREADLLLDEKTASINAEKNVAGVIAHEMAHQWFGDLVTMKWWNDIWLNEGFATWMSSKPVAAWKPEWKIEEDDVLGTAEALNTDSVKNTRPIRQKAESRTEINSLFDGIAYGKTAAVLRMLESYLGPEEFRKGVNLYLESHKYSNATAEDFWNAMTKATGKPVDKIMPTFVTEPGAPYVAIEAKCENGETVGTLAQRRFYASAKLMQAPADEQEWQIPVCMSEIGGKKSSCDLVTQKQQNFKFKGCGQGVFGNVNGAGFYRYSFDQAVLNLPDFKVQELSEPDQVSIVGDEAALLGAGQEHIQSLMALMKKFSGVESASAVGEIGEQLAYARDFLVTDADRAQFQTWVRDVFKPTMAEVGYATKATDTPDERNLRATLIGVLGDIGEDPDTIEFARKTVQNYMRTGDPGDPTLLGPCFGVAAAHGDAALYDAFLAKLKNASKDPTSYYHYFNSLARFRDPALLKRTMEWALGPDVRNQDLFIMFGVLRNQYGQQMAWDFVREHFNDIVKKAGESLNGAQYAYFAVGVFCDPKHRAEAQEFLNQHAVPGMERVGLEQMERVDQCIEFRQREEPNLASYLAQQGGK